MLPVLVDGSAAWVAIGGLVIAGSFAALRSPAAGAAAALREAGTLLQLFGLGLVAYGLSDMRRKFGRPSVVTAATQWWRRLRTAMGPAQPITFSGQAGGVAIVSGRAVMDVRAGPNSSLERRVEILEQRLDILAREARDAQERLDRRLDEVSKRSEAESRAHADAVERLRVQLEDMAVGGLHFEMAGLVWLLFGTITSSLPEELVWLWNLL
jgi:hypothetical protein